MIFFKHCFFGIILLCVAACSVPRSLTPDLGVLYLDAPMQCVPYARMVSGIELYGNAYTWWEKAPPNYYRSHKPKVGAVMVVNRSKQMRYGHVAMVSGIKNSRLITVNHTNWGEDRRSRRKIHRAMLVQDVSQKNDWSRVRFYNNDIDDFGLPHNVRGFIYR